MTIYQCAKCTTRFCRTEHPESDKLPQFCPMRNEDAIQEAVKRYAKEDLGELYHAATVGEWEAYERVRGVTMAVRPRIREIAEFAKRIGAKKVGVAFCLGLAEEAARAVEILEGHNLEIHSVCCKCGAVDKSALGIPDKFKIAGPGKFEAGCNPAVQAEILNRSDTAFNVIVGLCVGHDMVFTRQSRAPVTTLIAKDRLTGHNPLAALYVRYHRELV